MEKINNETIILLSGDYLTKKYFAYKLLEIYPDFRVITLHDIARAMEQNLSEVNNISRKDVVDKIIIQQQFRKIPTIIFDKESLKNNCKGIDDVVHVNISSDEAGCTISVPELNLEIKSNNLDFYESAIDLYDKAVDNIIASLNELNNEQETEL